MYGFDFGKATHTQKALLRLYSHQITPSPSHKNPCLVMSGDGYCMERTETHIPASEAQELVVDHTLTSSCSDPTVQKQQPSAPVAPSSRPLWRTDIHPIRLSTLRGRTTHFSIGLRPPYHAAYAGRVTPVIQLRIGCSVLAALHASVHTTRRRLTRLMLLQRVPQTNILGLQGSAPSG